MSPFFFVFWSVMVASCAYAGGRFHGLLSYRLGYRAGWRDTVTEFLPRAFPNHRGLPAGLIPTQPDTGVEDRLPVLVGQVVPVGAAAPVRREGGRHRKAA